MALDFSDLSPRELAIRFTEEKQYFLSEATAYRILKDHDLITSPAWIVMKAADKFHQPTTAINQLWQTDFTYLKVTGYGWFYLSTVMDDYSRYIISIHPGAMHGLHFVKTCVAGEYAQDAQAEFVE